MQKTIMMMHCLKWWEGCHTSAMSFKARFFEPYWWLNYKSQKKMSNERVFSRNHTSPPPRRYTYIISSPCCYTLSANNCICPTLTTLHSKSVWFGNICSKPNNRRYYCMESSSKLWPSCWQLWTGKYLLNPIDQLEVTYDRWSFFKCFFFCNVSPSYSS